MNSYTIVKKPTFKTLGIISNNETGEDFNVWKVKYNKGVFFEDSDENRYQRLLYLIKEKLSHD